MPRSPSIAEIADDAEQLIFQLEKIAHFSEIILTFELSHTMGIFQQVVLTHQIEREGQPTDAGGADFGACDSLSSIAHVL